MGQQRFEIAAGDRDWIKRVGWRSVDDVLSLTSDDVAAVSSSSDVVRVSVGEELGGPADVYVKRYLYDRLDQRIKQMFRGTLFGKTRARREYEVLTEMRRRQVPTVRPIAFGERRRGAFLQASLLITEGSEGLQSLDVFAISVLRNGSFERYDRQALTKDLGKAIRRMHDAGVRHGGLYWRNILVGKQSDGGYLFTLLDPDTHASLSDSRVKESDAVADLSELVASGLALGFRGGLLRLLKAYFDVLSLNSEHRALARRILKHARPLALSEQRRMAVTEAIDWFRKRVAGLHQRKNSFRNFDSIEEFFEVLCADKGTGDAKPNAGKTICFSFSNAGASIETSSHHVIMRGEHVSVDLSASIKPDLVIRTDPETWLSVISGHPDAYDRIRAGRLRIDGDNTLLPALVEHIDRTTMVETTGNSASRSNELAENSSCRDTTTTPTHLPPAPRAFGKKYKADDYAEYYANKHDSNLGRRISNYFEVKMIGRALNRLRGYRAFESVLDCPSGTGRFLPTLAQLGASVIAMDTSGSMLKEGRKHYDLFDETPVALVGSAFQIALPDDSVDVVLCSRLLHHIPEHDDRMTILREFARVARLGVVLSFFDANSYRAWKRNRKTRRTGKPSGRHSMSRAACVEESVAAGLKPIGMNALLRFHTEVTAAAFLC